MTSPLIELILQGASVERVPNEHSSGSGYGDGRGGFGNGSGTGHGRGDGNCKGVVLEALTVDVPR